MPPHQPFRIAIVPVLATLAAMVAAVPASAASLPDLVTSGPSIAAGIVVRGHPFSVATTVRNQGAGGAAASTLRFYLSADTLRGAGDRRLTQVRQVARLAAHAASTGTTRLTPALTTPSGPFYVIACADDLKAVAEKSETNNCAASQSPTIGFVKSASSASARSRFIAALIVSRS